MPQPSLLSPPVRPSRWRFAFVALVVLGVFFRFYHLDRKLYNPDEANTSIRISGHTNADVSAAVFDGKSHAMGELTQFAVPTARTRVSSIVHSLAVEDPQHPPLYFLAMFASERATGDGIFWRRFPAMIFGIFAVAAAWLFGRELFRDSMPAWCLAALVAVSPFHVAFAQEAREYSLFLVATLLASAALLYALRTGSGVAYVTYAVAVATGFWSFTLFVFVAAAHLAYVVLPVSGADPKRRALTAVAAVLGALSFLPWMTNLLARSSRATEDMSWQASALGAPLYAGKFVFNLGSAFFDLDYLSLAFVPIALACAGVAGYAGWNFVRRSNVRVWFLPVAIGGLTLCAFLIPDLVRHETRALQNRYLTATWLALEIVAAGGFTIALREASGKRRMLWNAALAGLFACGIVSCAVGSSARTWWITGAPDLRAFPAIADKLASFPDATLVYLDNNDDLMVFEPYEPAGVRFIASPHLDAKVLHAAAHPFAILTSEQARANDVFPELERIPVDETFEMRPDPAVDRLRRSGAAQRKTSGRLDLALYTLKR